MKKYLPILVLSTLFIFQFVKPAAAATIPSPSPAASPTTSPVPDADVYDEGSGEWVLDKEVTYTGKLAARSADLLDWVIANYDWSFLDKNKDNPFDSFWKVVRTIVYYLLALFILAAAFLLMISRGTSITVRKFIPRFILAVVLVTLASSLIILIYQVIDIIQGLFLKINGHPISSKELLNVAFDYKKFVGYRRFGEAYDESAIIGLLLTKLTAATYYVMFAILIMRKVILWFFLIVSPVFPLLILFSPLRNSAKIWVGEFFRWLLYGPLFAIFLAGLVALWQNTSYKGIPLNLQSVPCREAIQKQNNEYPTSINILLGGPCQDIKFHNNLNVPDSFIQYVVALLMLWMVIIVPFILLKIFLDYFHNLAEGENHLVKYLLSPKPTPSVPPSPPRPPGRALPKPPPFPPINTSPPIPPLPPRRLAHAGLAMELPKGLGRAMPFRRPELIGNLQTQQSASEILGLTNLSIPTISDISRFETALLSHNALGQEEVNKLTETIRRLSGTSPIASPQEKADVSKLAGKLMQEANQGNPVAAAINEATKPKDAKLPEQNKVQKVNLEEYEEIKKTWTENYQRLEPPIGPDGKPRARKAWLLEEVKQIPRAIELLLSGDPARVEEGKQLVSKILPFLLLGGFSKDEIVAYLKAKLEAAKSVLQEIMQAEEEEYIEVERQDEDKPKEMHLEAKTPTEDGGSQTNSGQPANPPAATSQNTETPGQPADPVNQSPNPPKATGGDENN